LPNLRIFHWLRFPALYASVFLALGAGFISVALAESQAPGVSSPAPRNVVAVVPRLWPPQYLTDESGNPAGFAIDVMDAVAAMAGLTITYKTVDSFAKAVSTLKSGGADIIPNSGILPQRLDTFAFTVPVETFVISIFVRDDTHDLSVEADLVGRKLAVVETNIGKFLFGKRQDIDVQVYKNVRTALFELIAGQVDAIVYPQSVLLALARELGIEDRIKVVGAPLREIKRGIRVRKESTELLAVLNKAVENYVGTPAYQQVYAKWYGKPKPFWTTLRVLWFFALIVSTAVGWRYFSVVRLNRALQKSEERFRRVVEQAGDAMFVIDPSNGRLIDVNIQAGTTTGYTHDELLALSVPDIDPEFPSEKLGELIDGLKQGETVTFLSTHQRKDGSLFPVEIKTGLIELQGKIRLLAFARDISERKQAEERLRGAIESLQEGFILFDADDRLVSVNDVFRRINPRAQEFLDKGMTFEEMMRANVESGWLIEAQGREEAFLRERMAQHLNPGVPIIRLYQGGKYFQILESPTPEGGTAITFTDISERIRAEEAALGAQARMSGVLNIAPEAIITVGADMNIQLFNQGAERIFGYDADDVLGKSLNILMPERFRGSHISHVKAFSGSNDTYRLMDHRQELLGLRKDGREFPASASVSKLEIGGEEIFTVMLRDVTEQKRAKEALVAAKGQADTASHAKSQFLAAVSHELRTPLNAILGFAQILKGEYFGPLGDEKYREYAEDIGFSGELLLALVDDLLDISTIEAGSQSLAKEKLSTNEIINGCVKIVDRKALNGGINLSASAPEDLPPLYADLRAIRQILLNLLSNAIKFTPQGGEITVSAKASKKNTTIRVTDTGKGISAEKLPELTDMFVRAESDPYVAEKGWGLGLSITKSLVDLHEGKLDIESQVGAGTIVTVTLPNGAP